MGASMDAGISMEGDGANLPKCDALRTAKVKPPGTGRQHTAISMTQLSIALDGTQILPTMRAL